MSKNTSEYERWKAGMKKVLDSLVAKNFERLYNSRAEERLNVWGKIASELYHRYGLTEIKKDDPEYELKRKKEHCVYINMRIYVEKEFPWELSSSRVYRFVNKYKKLPKQLPEEWNNFELEERVKQGEKRREQDRKFIAFLEQYAKTHPKYASR